MVAPAIGFLADAGILIFYLFGWGVALGLLYTWDATFHHLFKGIADLLSFTIHGPLGWSHTFHLGGWANTIDHKAKEFFSDWALGCEIIVGKTWHGMGQLFWAMSHAISNASNDTLNLGHWLVHDFVPGAINAFTDQWKHKTNKAAAVAAGAAAGLALLKRAQRAEHAAEGAAASAAKSAAHAAQAEASHAKSVATTVEHVVTHETKVITEVVNVAELPTQFGRTVKQIRRRLGKVEALLGATAMAVAMANVLGIPNPRCLTKGPVGRFSRALCGMPTNLLNDLLGLIADYFVVSHICDVLPFIEDAASTIGTPLVAELTKVGAGLCDANTQPAALVGPMPTIPALVFGVSASGV